MGRMAPFITMAAAKSMVSLGCSLRIELLGPWLLSNDLCLLCCRYSLCIKEGDHRCYLESSTSGFETIVVTLILISSKRSMPIRTDRIAYA